jgi:hypothetical protein
MTYKYAHKVFTHIDSTLYTTTEKLEAIYIVTHSDVAKPIRAAASMEALRWLIELERLEPEWKRRIRKAGKPYGD